jgi:hypothetical protein
MERLSESAQKIMDLLKQNNYKYTEYLPASRLHYLFDDPDQKARSVAELVARGFVTVAANGALGITPAGEQWNAGTGSLSGSLG